MLDHLPNEILLQILASMADLETLHSFLRSYPASQDLFVVFSKEILASTIRQNNPLQIQHLICTDLCMRQNPYRLDLEELEEYLELHVENEKTPPRLENCSDPILALQHSVTVVSDIEYHVQAFISSRLRKPGVSGQSLLTQDPASPTELLRIRRGFWRLHLMCELLNIRSGTASPVPQNELMIAFVVRITPWELKEMECVYYFLREQYELLRIPDNCERDLNPSIPVASQSPRVQRMLRSFGYKPGDQSPVSFGLDCYGSDDKNVITKTLSWGQYYSWYAKARSFWSDEVVSNVPNEGWRHYDDNHEELRDGWPQCQRITPGHCFLTWGYCIWDKKRLEDWGVLGPYSFPDWHDGGHGHCYYC